MTQDNWNKAREYKDKLLEHYNSIIKPTLLDFYNITQDEFTFYIEEQEDTNMPSIRYKDGSFIHYYKCNKDTLPTYSILLDDSMNTLQSMSNLGYNRIDIRMVKMLVRYWRKIRAHLDTRIGEVVLEYSTLLSNKEEE